MASPVVDFSEAPITEHDADAVMLVIPLVSATTDDEWQALPGLRDSLESIGFTGAAGSYARVAVPQLFAHPVAVVGSGAGRDAASVRNAVGVGSRTLAGFATVAVALPFHQTADAALAAAEGAGLGGYSFASFKKEPPKPRATRVVVHAAAAVPPEDAARVRAVIEAVALVKDLVTTPADALGPADMAEVASDLLTGLPVTVQVWDENDLATGGFGGILGVGRGSVRPPRLIRAEYAPDGATRHVALVGKGITFDSGGLSLKPAAGMVDMKYDMCGAATVLAVLRAIAEIGAPVRVSAWLCLAENMPSGTATRPGDVLRIADGTTVEVLNTDAEGRLVLADGLVAASREHPDLIVDVATLTGAITTALGTRHAGVMGDDETVARYLAAADRVNELAWQMPLPDHMVDELDSPIADLRNAKVGDPAGGSLFAGLFLRHFVGTRDDAEGGGSRIPWVHLDIAGVGMNKGAPFGFTDMGPTAATTRSLIEFVLSEASR
ncbi:MAG: leucyl aminopeptidase [Microbacterium sp. 67-17]|uniref:leucyl aminopeptidase n=1 Tax=Microbacterium sp. 67-17 TaxID=1895782 RepID=UPI00095EF2EE|nr:leucyl aminopeptidase [Microbacterium sp. 67-17]OJV96097.1 MAG: leucyl aminopeptidase [Microbacterium sp. 67-17]